MKILLLKLVFILALWNPETNSSSCIHTANSGEFNLAELDQIECLIRKKAGAELEKNHENSFTLNGHSVFSEVVIHRYGPSIFEESFYEIQNPNNEYRMRLVKNINGDRELAIMICENDRIVSYHAVFDSQGIMLEEDPWGKADGYSIEIFDLYEKYQKIFSQRVDAKEL